MEEQSLAMALIKSKDKIIIILVICWLTSLIITNLGYLWYLNQFDYTEVQEYTNTTDEGGNACIGDNCNNGNGF